MNLDELLVHSWELLKAATTDRKSPMRLGIVGTQNATDVNLRTVVLRQVKGEKLLFYTDFRSPKVKELQANNTISWLFYDSTQQVQLRLYGRVNLLHNSPECLGIWKKMPDYAKKDYITSQAPSSNLEATAVSSYLSNLDASNFCVVVSNIYKIDYLKLQRAGHIRVKFEKNSSDQWEGIWLVP